MSPIQWLLALAGIAGPVFVLLVMIRRGLRSKFPLFFNYLILYICISCVGLAAYFYSCSLFFHVSWILGTLMMVMEFGVIYEVLTNTLKSYSALVDLAKILFWWAALFLLLTGLITAFATNGQQDTRLFAALGVLEHCIRLMQCGLLLFLLVFEARLGVSWRNHGVAIAVGLGSYAAIDLTLSYITWISARASYFVGAGAFIGALAIWGCALAMREPQPKSVLDTPARLIFQRWNEALMTTTLIGRNGEIAAMSPVESFLPGVERTVERVMARKMMH